MLSELFIYILIGLLFLSTLILPIGNYYNDSNRELSQNKINEKIEYVKVASQNELSDYVILANEDYVFISNTSIENSEDDFEGENRNDKKYTIENIVDQFKLDKRYYNKLHDDKKEYKGYKVIAEFRSGVQIYPMMGLEQNEKYDSEKSQEYDGVMK